MATAVLQQQQQQASAEPDGQQRVKVFVSGCYDILHGGGLVALTSQDAAAVQLLPALSQQLLHSCSAVTVQPFTTAVVELL
jgi:bifunctional ADP-heptose synthase (sugar kinase/adenylyltransferase)